jgi:transposase
MRMRKPDSPEFKAKLIVALLKDEHPARQVAAEHSIHPTMLYHRREAAYVGVPQLFSEQAAQRQAP